MSQIDVASKPQSAIARRTAGLRARAETFVREFEWTWTNAVLFSMALTFFILISTSVVPSFWMYYAEQTLQWGGPTDLEGFLSGQYLIFDIEQGFPHLSQETYLQIRDAVAMGLTTLPFVVVLVVGAAMQNWRTKLRGGSGESRPTGGYR
jgi:hypothetical protein